MPLAVDVVFGRRFATRLRCLHERALSVRSCSLCSVLFVGLPPRSRRCRITRPPSGGGSCITTAHGAGAAVARRGWCAWRGPGRGGCLQPVGDPAGRGDHGGGLRVCEEATR